MFCLMFVLVGPECSLCVSQRLLKSGSSLLSGNLVEIEVVPFYSRFFYNAIIISSVSGIWSKLPLKVRKSKILLR